MSAFKSFPDEDTLGYKGPVSDDPKTRIIEVSGVAHRASQVGLQQTRPETGAMVFGDDWTGLFIRGDNAAGYRTALHSALTAMEEGRVPPMHDVGLLRDLLTILGLPAEKDDVQELQAFDACEAEPSLG